MTIGKLASCVVVASSLAASAQAGTLDIYEHNGSVVDWFIVGDAIKATYATPKPSLQAAGIRSGTVIFEGNYQGDRIVGTAYAFKGGCAPAGYSVIGEQGRGYVVLRGPSPRRARDTCDVLGYTLDSPNAVLRFRYSATDH